MADPEIDVKIRVQVAQDLLTRAGINGKQQVEVEVRNWADVLEGVLVEVDDPNVIDAVVVSEPNALQAAWDAEAERRYVQRRRRVAQGKSPAIRPSEQAALERGAAATVRRRRRKAT